jgi:hypothetical protein
MLKRQTITAVREASSVGALRRWLSGTWRANADFGAALWDTYWGHARRGAANGYWACHRAANRVRQSERWQQATARLAPLQPAAAAAAAVAAAGARAAQAALSWLGPLAAPALAALRRALVVVVGWGVGALDQLVQLACREAKALGAHFSKFWSNLLDDGADRPPHYYYDFDVNNLHSGGGGGGGGGRKGGSKPAKKKKKRR